MELAFPKLLSALTLSLVVTLSPACARRQKNGDGVAPTATSGKPCERWISGAAARKVIDEGGLLLDVRTPREYAEGHLDGALNIEVDQLSTRMSEIPKDRHVVVYCQSGRRAERAALMLEERGHTVSELGVRAQYSPSAPAGCPD